MSVLFRRELVLNHQQGFAAVRLRVDAPHAGAAVAALNRAADVWPRSCPVLVSLGATPPDAALLDWARPERALLELPAACVASPAGAALTAQLAAAGMPLCLNGFVPGATLPGAAKFHFVLAEARQVPQISSAPGVPLATGLADHDAFADAIDGGYEGGAGWFFLHGLPPAAARLSPGHAQIIHILNLVRHNAAVAEIEGALKQDLSISFKLLRYINSAGFGMTRQIESFRHAVTLIGYSKLNKWLSLLLVTASHAPAAPALMHTAIVRGRFMELVAAATAHRDQQDNLFITGSFSLLDALLGTQLAVVLREMHLPEDINRALLARSGPYAAYLELALACEHDDPADLAAQATALGIAPETLNRAQIEALDFADSLQLD